MRGLITGAARGLGKELVREGLERGHHILAASRTSPEEAKALMELKKRHGERLCCVQMDVTSDEQVKNAAFLFRAKYGSLDFLINNAGVMYESKYDNGDIVKELDLFMLERTLAVNTIGPARVLKHFADMLYPAPKACIINITSEAGHLESGDYHYPAYGMSKHAANMYTQKICNYIRSERKESNIRIFMVHPGRMNTVMGRENAQIEAAEASCGIFDILEGKISPKMKIPFINYKGEPMNY